MKLSKLIEVLRDNSYKIGNFKNSKYYKENKEEEIKVGVYIRRSKRDRKSIENQISSVIHVLKDDFAIEEEQIRVYKDNGLSGTDDKRLGYLQLKKDLEYGTINTVVVANIDRFGRTTEDLLNDIFPCKKVSYLFISLDDLLINSYQNRASFLKKIHEADNYAASTSRKIRRVLKARMKEGSCISSRAPYAYQIIEQDGNRILVIGDTFKADIVKKIFIEYVSGKSLGDIIRLLNAENIKTPTGKDFWSKSTVKSILQNPIYKGDLYQGKFQKQSYINSGEGKQVKKVNNDEWIFSAKCPAVIDEGIFNLANQLLEQNKLVRTGGSERKLFTGILKCRECGASLIYRKKSKSYQCSNSLKPPYKCTTHLVSECDLKEIISPKIKDKLQKIDEDILNVVKERLNMFDSSSYYKMELNELENEIDKLLDKLLEVDKKDKYADRLIKKIKDKISVLEEQQHIIEKRIQENDLFNKKVNMYLSTLQEDIDKNFIYRLFIKDIIISDKEEIEINWRI